MFEDIDRNSRKLIADQIAATQDFCEGKVSREKFIRRKVALDRRLKQTTPRKQRWSERRARLRALRAIKERLRFLGVTKE